MTVVRFSTALRRAGTTLEQYHEHWRTTHAEAVRALSGLGRYFQNHLVLERGRPLLPWAATDGCAEIEFPDLETMEAAFAPSPASDAVRADSALFTEHGRGGLTLMERHVLADGPPPEEGVKLLTIVRRVPTCEPEDFLAALRGPYAEAAAGARPQRHEQLLALGTGPPAQCEAVDLLWFADAQAAAAFPLSSAGAEAARALAGRALGSERQVVRAIRVH